MAAKYLSANILGVDLTPPTKIQGSPSNCSFVNANVEQDWTFVPPGKKFDLIYARMLANGMHDWPRFFTRCFEHLNPGGWLEIPDVRSGGVSARDGRGAKESPALQWFELFRSATVRTGIDPYANQKHTHRLRDAGFINIKETFPEWLVGGASATSNKEKQIGDIHLEVMCALITGATETLLQHEPGTDAQEVLALAGRAKEDLAKNQKEAGFFLHL